MRFGGDGQMRDVGEGEEEKREREREREKKTVDTARERKKGIEGTEGRC